MTRAEYVIYCRGYLKALTTALQVMEFTLRQRALRLRDRRRAARLEAIARRSLPLGECHVGEEVRAAAVHRELDHGAEHTCVTERNFVGVLTLRVPVTEADYQLLGGALDANIDANGDRRESRGHPATLHPDGTPAQPPEEPDPLYELNSHTPVLNEAHSSGEFAYRYDADQALKRPEKRAPKTSARPRAL